MTDQDNLAKLITVLEAKLGASDVPSAGAIIRWFGAKTPEGILVLAVAFCIGSIGLWVFAHAIAALKLVF